MKTEIIGKEYLILREIDQGLSSIVYLVKSMVTGQKYVAKVYKTKSEYYLNEVSSLKILSSLNCPNIIHIISYGDEPIIKDGIPEKESHQYIILDYVPNKDLFSYVKGLNGLEENECKFIFYKILKAVEICHKNGICHRDLKLENILLDENYNPIICDFGFSSLIENADRTKKLTEYIGTESYLPPEIIRRRPYDGYKCDIFCLGVILFTLVFCSFGFGTATYFNKFYKLIMKNKFEQYWEEIGNNLGHEKINNISPELKRLYFKMVNFDPNKRPSIEEILNDEWMIDI